MLFEKETQPLPESEAQMGGHAAGMVIIQTSPESVPATPSWFGEVVLVVTSHKKQGVLTKLCE